MPALLPAATPAETYEIFKLARSFDPAVAGLITMICLRINRSSAGRALFTIRWSRHASLTILGQDKVATAAACCIPQTLRPTATAAKAAVAVVLVVSTSVLR